MKTYLLFLILIVGCTNSFSSMELKNIKESQWIMKIEDDCIDLINFRKDMTYRFYNCEMDDTIVGKYHILKDTLILNQIGSVYDSLYSQESIHRIGKAKFKLVLQEGMLRFISREDFINGYWIDSSDKLNSEVKFKRVQTP